MGHWEWDLTFGAWNLKIGNWKLEIENWWKPENTQELKDPTPARSNAVILAMTWFSFFLYIVTGIVGYSLFGNRQCPVITNS